MFRLKIDAKPCSVNNCFRATKSRVYLSPQYRKWRTETIDAIKAKLPLDFKPFAGEIEIYVTFRVNNKRKNDVDNMLKSFLDACNRLIWCDDSQIYHLHALRVVTLGESPSIQLQVVANHTSPQLHLTSVCTLDSDICVSVESEPLLNPRSDLSQRVDN